MTCEEFQLEAVALLAGQLSSEKKKIVEEHLESCAACAEEVKQLRSSWDALDVWQEQPLPAHIAAGLSKKARLAVEEASEKPRLLQELKRLAGSLEPLAPFGMGLVTAIASAIILSSRLSLEHVPHLALTTTGALWTALYGLVFYLFMLGTKKGIASWRYMAQASLVAVGIFLLLTIVSPLPSSVRFCSNFRLTQPFIERLSVGGSFFFFGALYALIPMGIASYLTASRRVNGVLLRGSMAGGMFVLLVAPSIFLQCAPFALGTLVGWFGGALVGSVIGGSLGYWMRFRLARGS
jgi:hypothetical protein